MCSFTKGLVHDILGACKDETCNMSVLLLSSKEDADRITSLIKLSIAATLGISLYRLLAALSFEPLSKAPSCFHLGVPFHTADSTSYSNAGRSSK